MALIEVATDVWLDPTRVQAIYPARRDPGSSWAIVEFRTGQSLSVPLDIGDLPGRHKTVKDLTLAIGRAGHGFPPEVKTEPRTIVHPSTTVCPSGTRHREGEPCSESAWPIKVAPQDHGIGPWVARQ